MCCRRRLGIRVVAGRHVRSVAGSNVDRAEGAPAVAYGIRDQQTSLRKNSRRRKKRNPTPLAGPLLWTRSYRPPLWICPYTLLLFSPFRILKANGPLDFCPPPCTTPPRQQTPTRSGFPLDSPRIPPGFPLQNDRIPPVHVIIKEGCKPAVFIVTGSVRGVPSHGTQGQEGEGEEHRPRLWTRQRPGTWSGAWRSTSAGAP